MVRTRMLTACAFAAGAMILAACGGGAGVSTSPPASVQTASPTPNPTSSGDAFTYTGAMTESITRWGTPTPSPSIGNTPAPATPTATPWLSSTSLSIQQSVAIVGNATFNGQGGLTDFISGETETGTHYSYSSTTDSYVADVPSTVRVGGTDVTLLASTTNDSTGASFTTLNGSGNGVYQQLPLVTGAQWSEAPTRTVTEKDADGEITTSAYASDGTYTGSTMYPEGATASIQTNADGSGIYGFPLAGLSTNSSVSVAAPQNDTIGIDIIFVPGQSTSDSLSLADWYPQAPPMLASDTFADEGITTLPATCDVASAYLGPSTAVVESRVRLDTVFGELEKTTQTTYVSATYGPVCIVTHDDLETYYDYSGQSGGFEFMSTPVQSTIADQTLALQHASFASTSARRLAAAAFESGARAAVMHVHRLNADALYRFMQSRFSK